MFKDYQKQSLLEVANESFGLVQVGSFQVNFIFRLSSGQFGCIQVQVCFESMVFRVLSISVR